MDKKPLIVVSICAVVLLVLGSLSNVVGYQSVKSTLNDSPLFSIKIQEATFQKKNSITSQYLGKNKEINFFLPNENNKNESLKILVKDIKKMDDNSLQRLGYFIISVYNYKFKDFDNRIENKEIFASLKELRDAPPSIINNILNDIKISKNAQRRSDICTLYCTLDISEKGCFLPGLIFILILLFDVLIAYPIQAILWLFTISWVMVCTTQSPPC
jgi:hypothetical protein